MTNIKKLTGIILVTIMLFTACISLIPAASSVSASPLSSESGYANVALGKSYTKDTIASNYPDENGTSMTDGTIAASTAKFGNSTYMAFDYSAEQTRNGCGAIIVDLGSIHKLDKFVAHVAASGNGNGDAGVYAPQLMSVHVSTDNTNWYKAGDVEIADNGSASMTVTLELSEIVTARYVRYRFYDSKMWKRWIFVSEVQAFGVKTDTAIPYPEVEELKFLFIGNSATFYFQNPIKFMLIAESAGINVDLTYCTIGSSYISDFASTTTVHGKDLRKKLAEKKYDYIVIHDNSNADYGQSQPALKTLMPLFEENGAEVVLYKRYSSSTNAAQRVASAYKHHLNYTKMASTFDIEKVAPVADAFLISTAKYPEINLHHTDNSHHNHTSSYLIALVWAKTFLGIDLDDVTYTSDIGATTANKLKDVANIACDEGYAFEQLCYTKDGVAYRNAAANKDYTVNGNSYTGDSRWTDTTNGNTKGKLTDTAAAANGNDHAIGAYTGKSVDITIDLGAVYDIVAFKNDMFGNTNWGIVNPADNTVTYSVSNDGVTYTPVGTASRTDLESPEEGWTAATFTLVPSTPVQAKYVRVTYKNNNDVSTPYWTSEVNAYGTLSENQPENPPVVVNDNLAYGKTYTISGLYTENGNVVYPDENGKSLTDGYTPAADAIYSDSTFAGFNRNSEGYAENGYADITVDLGDVYAVDKFVTVVGTKMLTSGITAPSKVEIYVSTDKTNWKKAGETEVVDTDATNTLDVTLELKASVAARYIQYRIYASESKNWIFVAEVEAYEGDPVVEPEYILGDVNNDGTIDSTDYLLVKRACFSSYTLSEDEALRADVDSNTDINSTDYVLIKRIAFGSYSI